MIFSSFEFLFGFLPIVLFLYFFFGRIFGKRLAILSLVLSSLVFYGWWNPWFVLLILFSLLFNYAAARSVADAKAAGGQRVGLAVGGIVGVNLLLLGYFKYVNFFVDNLNALAGIGLSWPTVILPIGISFFTFQQIAFQIDNYKQSIERYDFVEYCLFICFFPQLIAGPIVHHKEMMPQFHRQHVVSFSAADFSVGATIFVIGLFKKTAIADSLAAYATPIFSAAENGAALTIFEAWGATMAYTLQIYFDFSGYSDMAIGLARMFGIRLPLNFFSPYKAWSIVEFWRRWHMTLSRFLRDYVYVSLGGNRHGRTRRYVNLMATMLLGGLWHGAGWTFVFWGTLHGLYLVINHAWSGLLRARGVPPGRPTGAVARAAGIGLTLFAVMVAWVFFRAESFDGATTMLWAMFGGNGIAVPTAAAPFLGPFRPVLEALGIGFDAQFVVSIRDWAVEGVPIIALGWFIALGCPNTFQILRRYEPALAEGTPFAAVPPSVVVRWQPSPAGAAAVCLLMTYSVMSMSSVSEFLYFQF